MSTDGRTHYSPIPVSDGKGELESIGILLPPLIVQTDSSSKSWHRKAVISAIALTVVALLTGIIVAVFSSEKDQEPPVDFTVLPTFEKPKKQIKPKFNFRIDLTRAYENFMEEKRPEDLKKDFDYYKSELLDVRNPSDLREFLEIIGFRRIGYDLSEEDVRFAINATLELHDWYTHLEEVKKNLTKYDTQKRRTSPAVTSFRVMNRRRNKELNALMKEWTAPISTDVSESRAIFKNKVIIISEVLALLKSSREFLKKDIYIFSSGIIYLDEDISMPETNLALIAPSWSFVKNVNAFTNGLDGKKHENDTAASGKHGLPGRRGGSGGHFFGIGDMTVDEFHVQTDGGHGNDGQHGSDGQEGTINKPKSFTSKDPFRCKKPVNDIKNVFGELITYYEVFHEYGCGGNGTDGGAGGPGGEGGRVILLNVKDGSVKEGSGRKGTSGKGGKGGSGGLGANWGCRFFAEGTENGKIQRVTKEVCGFFMPSGSPGRDGWHRVGMEEPIRRNSSFFVDVLRELRAYARKEYAIGRKDAWELAEKLDRFDIIDNRTVVRDFINEINEIEKFGIIEFYESFNRRIEKAMEGSRNEEVLMYLRTLSYAKCLALKNGFDNYVTIDLDVFLEKVSDDLKIADKKILTYKDHTAPIFLQLLKGKMHYLNDMIDRWLYKTSKLMAYFDLKLNQIPLNLPQLIDGRNMAYLTSVTAQVMKSLSVEVLVFPGEEKKNVSSSLDFVVNDFMVHKKSKSSTERFSRHKSRFLMELKSLSGSNWKQKLKIVKRSMEVLNNLIDPQGEVSDFPVVLECFESTANLLETVREKEKFRKYIDEINSFGNVSDEAKSVRDYLFETLITTQYKNALSAFRQWVFPHMQAYSALLPKKKNMTLEDIQAGINILRKSMKEYKSTITCYDKYIREAVFSSNNSVGEYYKWYNDDIRSDLRDLFTGREISLTADLENFHMMRKNAIKFRTVKLEFQTNRIDPDKLSSLLTNTQVEMRHSGYSYYYYNGRSYLKIGEGFDLRYSYENTLHGLPVNFNMVYKKLMEGPPIFSPYTTWTIRLDPIPDGLDKFAEDVDVALVGLGSYIEVVDNI